jgi:biotin synthase
MLDERAMQIADNAALGKAPTRSDVVYLLRFDAYSPEAAYVNAKAREIGMRACEGRGYVYAQIGVDSTACPENCEFCSFAAMNTDPATYDATRVEVPIGRIVHYAKQFSDAGVDLISLMATAGLNFDRYLDMVRAVAASVPPDLTVMANTGDLTLEQAQALRDAGATAAYHALRLGEGEITAIKPIDRRRTMRYLHAAGVSLMTGVEPVWRGIDPLVLSERICDIPEFDPFCMGACSLTAVDGINSSGLRPALTGQVRYVAALTRLVCGENVPIGGIGGVAWVDAGCDPRNRGYGDDDATLRKKVAAVKRSLALDGFVVG